MRPLVQDAGKPLYAGWLSRVYRLSGETVGDRWVGGRRVRWVVTPRAVSVRHADATGKNCGYLVTLSATVLPSGGQRWWFHCPECSRRVDVLYLPDERNRLACRKCCGLVYRSQYTRHRVRHRLRRPRLEYCDWLRLWIRR